MSFFAIFLKKRKRQQKREFKLIIIVQVVIMVVVRRRWFETPWEFRESALFTAVALCIGFVIEYATSGSDIALLRLPGNAIALSLFAVLVLSIGLGFRNTPAVKWFGGIPLGLSLIVAIAVLSLIGGILPQEAVISGSLPARLGIHKIFSSWPFALIVLLFLSTPESLDLCFFWCD